MVFMMVILCIVLILGYIEVSFSMWNEYYFYNIKYRLEMDQVMADKTSIELVHSKHLMTLRVEEQTSKQQVLDLVQKVILWCTFDL